MHTLSTKYNVLYNGQIAFDQAKLQLDDNYDDNFWEILPIEPLKIEAEKSLDLPTFKPQQTDKTENTSQGFEKAEEKAIKAAQLHSMDIGGKERNKQIDEAYLLLGKSRYYAQRFVPALEAFNYILDNFSDSNIKDETRVWQAKTLVRLQNEKLGIETLSYLLKNPSLPLETIEKAHTAMALAYQSIDSTNAVIRHLDSATIFSANPKQKARNLFILGQLFRQEQKIDSSNITFENLGDFKKAPLRYKVMAQIERAKNYAVPDSAELILTKLDKLIRDRDHRPFLDGLYFQKGMIQNAIDSTDLAIESFESSLSSIGAKDFQKEMTFEQLGNLYFDSADFAMAGAYYDSVIDLSKTPNAKRVRRIVRKRKNLEEVITYEAIANYSDSILIVAAMSEAEQQDFYQKHIDELKAAEELARIKLENTAITTGNANNVGNNANNNSGTFYFYNNQVASFGRQSFKRTWGNRPLEDNWRLSDKKIKTTSALAPTLDIANTFNNSKKYELDYYISRIPKGEAIDSIKNGRDNAYYRLGLIYKEQFKEYPLAAKRLTDLLSFKPAEKLILPTNYHLYKIYANFDEEKSNTYKEEIIKNFPGSRYAKIILNPTEILASDVNNDSPESVYNDVYCDFDFQHYDRAFSKLEKAIKQFEDRALIPKFELLKAYVLQKTEGAQAFKDALNHVAINYPNTEEGKHAVELLDNIDAAAINKN